MLVDNGMTMFVGIKTFSVRNSIQFKAIKSMIGVTRSC